MWFRVTDIRSCEGNVAIFFNGQDEVTPNCLYTQIVQIRI